MIEDNTRNEAHAIMGEMTHQGQEHQESIQRELQDFCCTAGPFLRENWKYSGPLFISGVTL